VLGWQEHTPRPEALAEGARPCARAKRFGTVLNPAFCNKNGKDWNRQSEGPHINHVVQSVPNVGVAADKLSVLDERAVVTHPAIIPILFLRIGFRGCGFRAPASQTSGFGRRFLAQFLARLRVMDFDFRVSGKCNDDIQWQAEVPRRTGWLNGM